MVPGDVEAVVAVRSAYDFAATQDLNAVVAHDPGDTTLTDLDAQFVQFLRHARTTVAAQAEASEIDERIRKYIERDLPDGALEGMEGERRAKVRRRAAWLAQKFVMQRRKNKTLHCDHCEFDPHRVTGIEGINPRSLLDVHHMHPLDEGVRYTTVKDFALLCPTCHRVEHARIKVAATGVNILRISEDCYIDFLRRWVSWMTASGIAKVD